MASYILPTPVYGQSLVCFDQLLWMPLQGVKWPQVSNWLVTSAGVSNLVINLIKAQNIKGNYSKIFLILF